MPIASFTVTTSFYTVSVDASASTAEPGLSIASYEWDWGDSTNASGMINFHNYAMAGPYTITLTVIDSLGQANSTTWDVEIAIITNQYRYAMETLTSPFPIPLNPGPVHDHDSVYIYRVLPVPIAVELTFHVSGLSYVEVFDADNQRFLLPEKTEITQDTMFVTDWDGEGVFEVRVWKDGFVDGIEFAFVLPTEQVVQGVTPELRWAPLMMLAGLSTGSVLAASSHFLKRGRKK